MEETGIQQAIYGDSLLKYSLPLIPLGIFGILRKDTGYHHKMVAMGVGAP